MIHVCTHTHTHTHTHIHNQEISQAVLLVRGVSLFSTALEVIPGHTIAFAVQSSRFDHQTTMTPRGSVLILVCSCTIILPPQLQPPVPVPAKMEEIAQPLTRALVTWDGLECSVKQVNLT